MIGLCILCIGLCMIGIGIDIGIGIGIGIPDLFCCGWWI
jgi:hypothetical protein